VSPEPNPRRREIARILWMILGLNLVVAIIKIAYGRSSGRSRSPQTACTRCSTRRRT
jgi:divalent metal cation (Fe/Co/Zn/Cd) transporter